VAGDGCLVMGGWGREYEKDIRGDDDSVASSRIGWPGAWRCRQSLIQRAVGPELTGVVRVECVRTQHASKRNWSRTAAPRRRSQSAAGGVEPEKLIFNVVRTTQFGNAIRHAHPNEHAGCVPDFLRAGRHYRGGRRGDRDGCGRGDRIAADLSAESRGRFASRDSGSVGVMGSVSLRGIHHQYGAQIVLDDVRFEARSGEIVALVGPNGAGKTTLLRIIGGMLEPQRGEIKRSRGLRIGYLAQEPELDPDRSLRAEINTAFAHIDALERELHDVSDAIAACRDDTEHAALLARYDRLHARIEAAGGYQRTERIGEVVHGLGFTESDLDLPVAVLSGGQKCRAALAKLLLAGDDLLLLDEPTNHLDIDAVHWLERFLERHRGGAVIVSHDRYLLDRLAQRIVEVDRTRIREYSGNYSNYVATKARDALTRERQRVKDTEFVRKERDFIARHLAGQRTKEAKGRRARLQRRLADGEFVLEKQAADPSLRMAFDQVAVLSGPVVRVDDLTMGFGEKQLFADLGLQVPAGNVLGITGPNGTGKTTLLHILRDALAPRAGEVSWHAHAQIGYFAQEAQPSHDPHPVLEALRAEHPQLDEQRARDLLAQFGFRGSAVFKAVAQLSGGEHSRLRLLMLLLEAPNVLVLDEPTNHLDATAREALEEALTGYPGTIIAVSHDRYFLDRLVDQLLVLRPDEHELHAGNYSSYITARDDRLSAERARAKAASEVRVKKKPTADANSKPARNRAYDALPVEEIEALIEAREERLTALNTRFAEAEVYRNPDRLAELHAEVAEVKQELAELETAWDERADA
jgi:ATP-binding cassette subfamily F protein 3